MTVFQLSQEFMKRYAATQLRPSTYRGYRTNFNLHILPMLGNKQLTEITLDDLDELTDQLREDKMLSNKSIVYVHATLRKSLNYARKLGYLQSNIYDCYDLPRVEHCAYTILTDDLFAEFLAQADGKTPVSLAIRLALHYGLRRGEILGIVPKTDLDVKDRTLRIQRTRSVESGQECVTPCKTKYSNRLILLKQEDVAALRRALSGYAVPITPTQLNKGFLRFLDDHGFPRMRFHDLRHSYATYMYRNGLDVKTLQTVLGHSSVKVTLDIYAHPDVNVQQSCLDLLP